MEESLVELVEVSSIPGNGTAVNKSSSEAAAPRGAKAGAAPVKSSLNSTSEPKRTSPLKGLKLNLNPKSVADLAPALGMLKSLYESGKERIAQLNAREKKLKKDFEERQTAHNARIAQIE